MNVLLGLLELLTRFVFALYGLDQSGLVQIDLFIRLLIARVSHSHKGSITFFAHTTVTVTATVAVTVSVRVCIEWMTELIIMIVVVNIGVIIASILVCELWLAFLLSQRQLDLLLHTHTDTATNHHGQMKTRYDNNTDHCEDISCCKGY